MSDVLVDLRSEYSAALRAHISQPDEESLQRAYELGRRALVNGLGLMEFATLHHHALAEVLPHVGADDPDRLVAKGAEEFFLESLAPFEMTHRAFKEATAALRRMHERVEEEAKRIAHALHDEAGTLLGSVHIALEELALDLPAGKHAGLAKVREFLDRMEQELRRLSHELRPTILDDLGLWPALDFLTRGVAKRTGLSITVEGTQEGRLPPAVETILYRSVQEALNNVVRHARARCVTVRVNREAVGVRCSVRDDGIGFEPSAAFVGDGERGLGLLGIRERVDSLGGSFQILSAPGRGTELIMQVPLGIAPSFRAS